MRLGVPSAIQKSVYVKVLADEQSLDLSVPIDAISDTETSAFLRAVYITGADRPNNDWKKWINKKQNRIKRTLLALNRPYYWDLIEISKSHSHLVFSFCCPSKLIELFEVSNLSANEFSGLCVEDSVFAVERKTREDSVMHSYEFRPGIPAFVRASPSKKVLNILNSSSYREVLLCPY